MQTDFTTLVDTLYGTTTTEIPNVIQILQPNPNDATTSKPTKKIDWHLFVYAALVIVVLAILYILWKSSPGDQQNVAPVVRTGNAANVPAAITIPEEQHEQASLPHHELLRAIEAVPRLTKPETFIVHGDIPTSDDWSEDSLSGQSQKLNSEGSDMQDYIRRREALTKTLESHQ